MRMAVSSPTTTAHRKQRQRSQRHVNICQGPAGHYGLVAALFFFHGAVTSYGLRVVAKLRKSSPSVAVIGNRQGHVGNSYKTLRQWSLGVRQSYLQKNFINTVHNLNAYI